MDNPFRRVMPERLELEFATSERRQEAAIERAWLDTARPHVGETYQLHVQLREFRGGTRTVSLPVRMCPQPASCAAVGAAKVSRNHAATKV